MKELKKNKDVSYFVDLSSYIHLNIKIVNLITVCYKFINNKNKIMLETK